MKDYDANVPDKKPPIAQNIWAAWTEKEMEQWLTDSRAISAKEAETKLKYRFQTILFAKNFDKRLWGPLLAACVTVKFYVVSEFSKPSYDEIKKK